MDYKEFIRQCYLKSTPSVDLNNVTKENPIDCYKHQLKISDYNNLIEKFCKTTEEETTCNMWTLQSGPQLIE